MPPTATPDRKRKFRFSFGLRTLFLLTAVAAVSAWSWNLWQRNESQRSVVSQLSGLGGANWSYGSVPAGPAWVRRLVGEAKLRDVVELRLGDTPFGDEDIGLLMQLPHLEKLILDDAKISDAKLAELQRARPRLKIMDRHVDPQLFPVGKVIRISDSTHTPASRIVLGTVFVSLAIAAVYIYRRTRRIKLAAKAL